MLSKPLASLFGTAAAYVFYWILRALYKELTSPWRNMGGPNSKHWFYGNLKQFRDDEDPALQEHWVQQYGPTFKYHRFFGRAALYTTDLIAIHHFLANTETYQKSEWSRFSLERIVGPGLLVVEGDIHKHQRRIMNPAFGPAQVRELTEIFVEKSIQLRDTWAAQAANSGGVARVQAISSLSKTTLDIIGLAGFNYKIDAIGAEDGAPPNELVNAFEALAAGETGFSLLRFLQLKFPVLRSIPMKRDQKVAEAQATMMRIGRRLLADSKREASENGTFEMGTGRARDLLSLLVRANTSKDLAPNQRLSDADVIAQVPTFLVAGHETTSTATTWALLALTQNTAAQTRLREELLSVSTDRPTMEELNALQFLDCVVRETLRVHAPVTVSARVALRDDVVPLGRPFTDTKGAVHESLHIRKGEPILIPILALNRDVELWGPDAMEFVPERWEKPPPGTSGIPGVWGHMLTFLGGTRSCIGYRFALVEMKALLFTLVRSFEFELAVPIAEMGRTNDIVQCPIVVTDHAAGNQLPLLVRPATH
ncbi:cytochrome P450 [Mycena capillaripes]|nr:cytochrome P450 [Mycena capillaripes]